MISIIIPVFKVQSYLHQCIESVRKQTYENIEIILIDDGSPDLCGRICDQYAQIDNRIRVLHTENRGLSAARNAGLREAKGEYVGFVDSDDWIEPRMYELLIGKMEETGADVGVCGFIEDRISSGRKHELYEEIYTSDEAVSALLHGEINNNVWNKLFRRSLFQTIKFPEGKNYEDVATMPMVFHKAERVVVFSVMLYHYRVRSKSITKDYSAQNLLDYAEARLRVYFYFKNESKELFAKNREILLCYVADGISKVWRWWNGCNRKEKGIYQKKIEGLNRFSKIHFPLTGFHSWPISLRITSLFMHSTNKMSFEMLYYINSVYRLLWPEKCNVV